MEGGQVCAPTGGKMKWKGIPFSPACHSVIGERGWHRAHFTLPHSGREEQKWWTRRQRGVSGVTHGLALLPALKRTRGCSVLDMSEAWGLRWSSRPEVRSQGTDQGQRSGGRRLLSGVRGQRQDCSSGSEGRGWEDCSLESELRTWEWPSACTTPQPPRPSE